MSKLGRRDPITFQRRTDAETRASAARIVDILQLLVLVRPDMIIPLEEIVRGILANLRSSLITQIREGNGQRGGHDRLPPVPLSELPAMLALLDRPSVGPARKSHRNKVSKQKRR